MGDFRPGLTEPLHKVARAFVLAAGCLASTSTLAQVEQRQIDLISMIITCGDWSQDIVLQEVRKRGYYKQPERPGPFWNGDLCGELVRRVVIMANGTIRISGLIAEPGQPVLNNNSARRLEAVYELIPDLEPDGSVSWDFTVTPVRASGASFAALKSKIADGHHRIRGTRPTTRSSPWHPE
jgi:hypothetical protein